MPFFSRSSAEDDKLCAALGRRGRGGMGIVFTLFFGGTSGAAVLRVEPSSVGDELKVGREGTADD